jgi:ferric-dicitrate binding protein FerR (iron transport regulator)
LQIQIDDASLAAKQVSGVFDAGDTDGFVRAIELYLPVTADYSDSRTVRLRIK